MSIGSRKAKKAFLPVTTAGFGLLLFILTGIAGGVKADTQQPSSCLPLRSRLTIPLVASDNGGGANTQALTAASKDELLQQAVLKKAGLSYDYVGFVVLPKEDYDAVVESVYSHVQAQAIAANPVFCMPTTSATATVSPSATGTTVPTATQIPTGISSPAATSTSGPSSTATPIITPGSSPSPTATATNTPASTSTPTTVPSPSPSPTPSPTFTPTPPAVACTPGDQQQFTVTPIGLPASLPQPGTITISSWNWCPGTVVTASIPFTSDPTAMQWVDFTFWFDSGGPSDGHIEKMVITPSSGTTHNGVWSTTWTVPLDGTIVHTHGYDITAQNGATDSFGGNPPGRTVIQYRENH